MEGAKGSSSCTQLAQRGFRSMICGLKNERVRQAGAFLVLCGFVSETIQTVSHDYAQTLPRYYSRLMYSMKLPSQVSTSTFLLSWDVSLGVYTTTHERFTLAARTNCTFIVALV